MLKRSSRQAIFFVLIFLMFLLFVKLGQFWMVQGSGVSINVATMIVGAGFTCIIVALYYLARLNSSSEGFWDITPAALCKGGAYMYQGDSQTAKMCQEMAKSVDGRAAISSYNCPTGYVGVPRVPFEYTPLSDDNWQDERTMDMPRPEIQDVPSMQSLTAQMQN
jgi:hypothetical protein